MKDFVNTKLLARLNIPDRSTSTKHRKRREEMSAKRLRIHAFGVENRELQVTVPQSKIVRMSPVIISDTFTRNPDPRKTLEISRESLTNAGAIEIVGDSFTDVFRQVTGDSQASCPENYEVDHILGLSGERPVELCDCKGFVDATASQAIRVMYSGAVVMTPLMKEKDLFIDHYNDPKNPMRNCLSCGELMDSSVLIRKIDPAITDETHTLCCGGMQEALHSGRVDVPSLEKVYLSRCVSGVGKLLIPETSEQLNFHFCPWCGEMIKIALLKLQTERFGHHLYSSLQELTELDKGWTA